MNSLSSRPTISDHIRSLAAAGHSRAEIARMVDRSYQQVRQVLVADEARVKRSGKSLPLDGSHTDQSDRAGRAVMADRAIHQVDVSDLGDNKSAKIRRYGSLGFSRTAIANQLGIKYQFVRNVLIANTGGGGLIDEGAARSGLLGFREPSTARYDAGLTPLPSRLNVDDQGRIQLPRDWELAPGQVFIGRKFGTSIVLMDVANASEVARAGGDLRSAADDLIAERRLEAMREFDD